MYANLNMSSYLWGTRGPGALGGTRRREPRAPTRTTRRPLIRGSVVGSQALTFGDNPLKAGPGPLFPRCDRFGQMQVAPEDQDGAKYVDRSTSTLFIYLKSCPFRIRRYLYTKADPTVPHYLPWDLRFQKRLECRSQNKKPR